MGNGVCHLLDGSGCQLQKRVQLSYGNDIFCELRDSITCTLSLSSFYESPAMDGARERERERERESESASGGGRVKGEQRG
jgi:hypothetical protein